MSVELEDEPAEPDPSKKCRNRLEYSSSRIPQHATTILRKPIGTVSVVMEISSKVVGWTFACLCAAIFLSVTKLQDLGGYWSLISPVSAHT